MKRLSRHISFLYCLTILTLSTGTARAQANLVLNPSFEEFSHCPDNWDEAKYSFHWMSLDSAWAPPDWVHAPLGVPEFCNSCATSYDVSIPRSANYYHYPRTQNGMMQVQMYAYSGDTGQARDYLQGHLAQTLIAGHKYKVCFYVTLEQVSGYAVNNIGAYLDDGSIDTTHQPGATQSQYTPQIIDTNIINDTLNWVKIEDTFSAKGTERLITIGQFSDMAHTRVHTISGGYSWYLVDDVSVFDINARPFAGNDTDINLGDSTYIGTHEQTLNLSWYLLGSSTPIGTGNGIWVHPMVSTFYVVEQSSYNIKTYDTVQVRVHTLGLESIAQRRGSISLYPTPAANQLTVENASGCELTIYNTIGVRVSSSRLSDQKQTISIESLPNGIYTAEIVDSSTGEKAVRKIIKE